MRKLPVTLLMTGSDRRHKAHRRPTCITCAQGISQGLRIGSLPRRDRARSLGRRKTCLAASGLQVPGRGWLASSMVATQVALKSSSLECVDQNGISKSGDQCPLRFWTRNAHVCSWDMQFSTAFQIPVTSVPAKHGIYDLLKSQFGSVLSVCRNSRETTVFNEGLSGGIA